MIHLYSYFFRDSEVIMQLFAYIDDIVLTDSSAELMKEMVRKMGKEFSIRELRYFQYFLGIQVEMFIRNPSLPTIIFSQLSEKL